MWKLMQTFGDVCAERLPHLIDEEALECFSLFAWHI